MVFDPAPWRNDTPAAMAGRIHLNNAGAALMPLPVIEAVTGHLDREMKLGGYEAADEAREEIAAMIRFCRALGLPTTLADLRIVEDVRAKIERVAEAALRPGEIIYATPVALSVPIVRDATLALDAFARSLD